MASAEGRGSFVQVTGDNETLVELVRGPVQYALRDRRALYAVRVETVGRVGEVLVSITGSKGRLPLIFRSEELAEAGYMSAVVSRTVSQFGF